MQQVRYKDHLTLLLMVQQLFRHDFRERHIRV
jgi:hypothetical protein